MPSVHDVSTRIASGAGAWPPPDSPAQLRQAVGRQGLTDVPYDVRHRRPRYPQPAEGAEGEVQGHCEPERDVVPGQMADAQAEQGQGVRRSGMGASLAPSHPGYSGRVGRLGVGERLGLDDVWVSRVGRQDLQTGTLAPDPSPVGADLLHRRSSFLVARACLEDA